MFKNSLNTWNYHWLARKENASSSKSGLYYSHWSAQSQSNLLSSDKYNPVNLALNNCTPLDRWQQSVSIMLEKIKGNINVAKVRAVLLLEADFDTMNKIICNSKVFSRVDLCTSISYEVIGGRRGHSSQHVSLNKKLVCDIGK